VQENIIFDVPIRHEVGYADSDLFHVEHLGIYLVVGFGMGNGRTWLIAQNAYTKSPLGT